ncbi:4-(cytidine 5'-diphospho)-2-C-methyl-D-erythritol kinase [Oricola sp.]|uniref:4-(cytidine 5'-diphospho)-2-C-methyl-D-erythritol kinase n=1 Tax=Oricola sp. TaxID=1979950 RepID=UPI003BA90123
MPRWYEANAKLNLALHVTGQRSDGYHLIETIAVFAEHGDRILVADSERDKLSISGPEAADLEGEDPARNLVVKARDFMRDMLKENGIKAPPVAISLEKYLPAGSGIGGGSADAAATIRALVDHWDYGGAADVIRDRSVEIGADLPMCMENRPLFASGIGESIKPLETIPGMAMLLVNPRQRVATPRVFGALENRANPSIGDIGRENLKSAADWVDWLSERTRNDLEAAAAGIAPPITRCLNAVAESGARLARMSGSGATCFGVYDSPAAAREAAAMLAHDHPDWWITATASHPSPELEASHNEQT